MWSSCHPKSDNELNECAILGKSLSRLTQPSILTVLARSDKPMHGYLIIQEMADGPMFGGNAPDPTGVYRILKQMENNGLVESAWDTSESGPAKRCYTLTDDGRACLRRWIDSLSCYTAAIEELRVLASDALGIDVPEQPVCLHEE
jgi:poly-beta-hydroxybutyrate-responsive repressor